MARTFIKPPVRVKGFYSFTRAGQAPGTFWAYWGGFITAAHVYEAMGFSVPNFAQGRVQAGLALIDACLIGCNLSGTPRPRAPVEGERFRCYGVPNGGHEVVMRVGHVKFQYVNGGPTEYSTKPWLAQIDDIPEPRPPMVPITGDLLEHTFYQPAVVGMSGGPVIGADNTPIGILVNNNGQTDLDGDGDPDRSINFVALRDVWGVWASGGPDAGVT